jgi:CRISPR-associated protein Cmr3
MTGVVSISFSIVEPMLFRSSGEFDPHVRGTFSRATSLIMPSPSTVVGTLATYCISKLNKPMPANSEDWIKQYLSVLGDDVKINGPILYLNNEFTVEDRTSEGFLSIEGIKQKCESDYNKLVQKNKPDWLNRYLEYSEKEKNEKTKLYIKIKKDARTGVRLETRNAKNLSPMKVVREGFLYNTELVDYISYTKNEQNRIYSVEIVAEIRGSLVKELPLKQHLPVRFGGESRVASLSFQDGAKIFNEIRRKLWNDEERYSGVLALYLATPAIFKEDKKVEEHIKEFVKNMKYEYLGVSGESMLLGAGFSIMGQKRKPIYSALKPGSIIFIKGEFNLSQLYLTNALGEAAQLGYGTIIPVPLTNLAFAL